MAGAAAAASPVRVRMRTIRAALSGRRPTPLMSFEFEGMGLSSNAHRDPVIERLRS
jgi:hypothetical protein